MIDNKGYKSKPTKFVGAITNRLKVAELSAEEIVNKIVNGYSLRPAILDGTTSNTFIEQQLILIDIDNNISMDNTLDILNSIDIKPLAIIPSFSYTQENNKHRVLILLDKAITDLEERLELIKNLNTLLSGDKQTTNPARLFFGTNKEPYYVDYSAINNLENYKKHLEKIGSRPVIPTAKEVSAKRVYRDIINIYNNSISVDTFHEQPSSLDIPMLRGTFYSTFFVNLEQKLKPFATGLELIKAINSCNLTDIFGTSNFNCIFHKDNNPSASIYKSEEGIYRYKCFSCSLNLNTVDIVAYLEGVVETPGAKVDINKFIDTMLKRYNLKIIEDKFIREEVFKTNMVNAVLQALEKEEDYKLLKENYPKVTTELKRSCYLLEPLMEHKMECVYKYPLSLDNNHVFFASTTTLAELTGKDRRRILDKLDKLTYLGLLVKVDDNTIKDTELYKTSLKHKVDNKYKFSVQYYILPQWSNKLFRLAEKKANDWVSSGATARASSVLQFQNIGAVETVKPKSKNKELTEEEERAFNILQKWATRTYSRNKIILKEDYIKYAKKNRISEVMAIKIITLVIANLELTRKTVTKAIIEKYSIKNNCLRKVCYC